MSASPAGRIARIGRITQTGREEIDADGHVVTPGFIDGHTHMDAQVFWDPLGTLLVLARRHHGRHGSLRVHPGARPVRAAPSRHPQPRAGRGHLRCRDGRRHRLELDDVRRVPRRRRPAAEGAQLRGKRWTFGAAHLRDGGAGLHRAGVRRGPRGDAQPSCATRCGPGPTGSPPRAPTTTRPPTTGPSPRGSRAGTRCCGLVGVLGDLGTGVFQLVEDPPDADERAGARRPADRPRRPHPGADRHRRHLRRPVAGSARRRGRGRWPDVRAHPSARHRVDVVVPQPAAVRHAGRMGTDSGAAAGGAAAGAR